MPLSTTNPKLIFLVWFCLYFAVKHPHKSVRLPSVVIKMLYGTEISAATVRTIRTLRWKDEAGLEHPVFTTVERIDTQSPKNWWVSLDVTLLEQAGRWPLPTFYASLFSGMTNIGRLVFDFAEKELLGELKGWNPENLKAIFISQLLQKQTATGSSVSIRPKSCPLCNSREIAVVFYGSLRDLQAYRSKNHLDWARVSLGEKTGNGPYPRWQCLTCHLKFWEKNISPIYSAAPLQPLF